MYETPPTTPTPSLPSQKFEVQQEPSYEGPDDPWTFTYASDVIKIVSMQQEQAFPDDDWTEGNWVLRLNTQESNPQENKNDTYWSYPYSWHLKMPNGALIAASESKFRNLNEISPGASRDNWVDFPLNEKTALSQLTLVVGEAEEQKIETKLSQSDDLLKYRSKSIKPGSTFLYSNGQWTVEKITSSFSANYAVSGEQALAGFRYIIVEIKGTFKDNGFSFTSGALGEMRLETGTTLQKPELGGVTVRAAFKTDTEAKSGTVIFKMPGGSDNTMTENMKLTFLASYGSGDVSISFQI
jgi:hypothetical protein